MSAQDELNKLIEELRILSSSSEPYMEGAEISAVADRLEAIAKAAPVPDGWQLVPKEPNLSQVQAAWSVPLDVFRIYEAMLAAAPKPEDVK